MSEEHRTRCCILGCKRTTGKPYSEWICTNHWRNVSKYKRRRHSMLKRRLRKDPTNERLQRMEWRAWRLCKEEAIKEALIMGNF